MKFVEELNQLITKHLGPKANLFDYSDAVEALLEAGHRLDEEAVTRFSENEFDAWRGITPVPSSSATTPRRTAMTPATTPRRVRQQRAISDE